ncbi:MAG: outer membrane beta-barrel protein, partial [Alphaproteobacteria bacterium]|nr:outer membrane beta-barrel protein [Alphaproteobacteria bacterium]
WMAVAAITAATAAGPALAQSDANASQAVSVTGETIGAGFSSAVPTRKYTGAELPSGPYAVKGVPLGGFRAFPSLQLGIDGDDNVYRTPDGHIGDIFFSESPQIAIDSQWSRNALDFFGALHSYQYLRRHSEGHNDWDAGLSGQLDIRRGINIRATGSYNVLHESRTSPDQPLHAIVPTQYHVTHGAAEFNYRPYHLGFTIGGSFDRYDYFNTPLFGLPPLNNTDRNRNEYSGYMRLYYLFSPGYSVYVEGDDAQVHYQLNTDRNGVNRDSHGYAANVGIEAKVTQLIVGTLFAGYLKQDYSNPLPNVSGLDWGANLDYFFDPLWTFHLTASRKLNGTTIKGAATEDDQSVRLAADYSMRENIMVHGYLGYTDSKFNGTPLSDRYLTAGLGISYLMNHNMSMDFGYDFQDRGSTDPLQRFTDNVAHIGVSLYL